MLEFSRPDEGYLQMALFLVFLYYSWWWMSFFLGRCCLCTLALHVDCGVEDDLVDAQLNSILVTFCYIDLLRNTPVHIHVKEKMTGCRCGQMQDADDQHWPVPGAVEASRRALCRIKTGGPWRREETRTRREAPQRVSFLCVLASVAQVVLHVVAVLEIANESTSW